MTGAFPRALALGVAALFTVIGPALAAEPQTLSALVAAAKQEGSTVDIAWGDTMYGGPDGADYAAKEISAKYGLNFKVNFTPLAIPGGAFESQIAQEVKAGQTASSDVLFNVYQSPEAAFMQPVDWQNYMPDLPKNILFFGNRAVAMVTLLEGFTYNNKLISPQEAPQSLADLLNPKWEGKIATSPYQGIEGAYLGLPQALGADGMKKFYTAFSKQVGGLLRCDSMDRIVSGEFLIFGVDCGDFSARRAKRDGLPIDFFYPREGAGLYYLAVGIPKTAAHPMSARLLVTFLLSRDGQEMLWDKMAVDNDKLPGSHMGEIVAAARQRGVKIIDAYGLDVSNPELTQYADWITNVVTQAK